VTIEVEEMVMFTSDEEASEDEISQSNISQSHGKLGGKSRNKSEKSWF